MRCFSIVSLILFSCLFFIAACSPQEHQSETYIQTVSGPIPADSLGLSLIHEHILVDFIGASSASSDRYSKDSVIAKVLPYLLEVKKFGVNTIFDCTPSYLAKDPIILQELSLLSGIQIVSNTGFYGAVEGKYLPNFAFDESAPQLADRWISEFENGIENTGVKPGFIKISVNEKSPLLEVDAKLVEAAGLTHLTTNLQIASHTGTWATAKQEVEILQNMDIESSAFVWVHAQAELDFQNYLEAAQLGVWISLDGIGWGVEPYVDRLLFAKEQGILDHVLISHDAGWYDPGKENGGDFQPFTAIFTELIPRLNKEGFSKEDWDQLLILNPIKAFALEEKLE